VLGNRVNGVATPGQVRRAAAPEPDAGRARQARWTDRRASEV